MSKILGVKEWADLHAQVQFTPPASPTHQTRGALPPSGMIIRSGTRFWRQVGLHHSECIINRVWASIDSEDREVAAALASRTIVRVMVDQMPICERPLNTILVGNVDAEVEERLGRLERMMNVLVEQDSPAGEALRRLGGAKIDGGSLLSITPPHVAKRHNRVEIEATINADVFFSHTVPVVNISIGGLFAREVL